MIPFNVPAITGKEMDYIKEAILKGHLSGNGFFTEKCHNFLRQRFNIQSCFLTTSCTDALEFAALLLDIKQGDEVIVPSFTFVSTALAFHRQGALIKFIDSNSLNPCMDEDSLEELINDRTKAVVPVHYAGIACNMDKITSIAKKYGLFIVEDAAHSIESFYKGKQLGTIGDMGCFSFHDSKPIHCGEGGMISINNNQFQRRAEILWEKGTNKLQFLRNETNYYEWYDTGSSFLPSEINSAFLLAQLENIESIIHIRLKKWRMYYDGLKVIQEKGYVRLPEIPEYCDINAMSFFIILENINQRDAFLTFMKNNGIICYSHYLPLHKSRFYSFLHDGRQLPNSIKYSETLVRLPLYMDLKEEQIFYIIDRINKFFTN